MNVKLNYCSRCIVIVINEICICRSFYIIDLWNREMLAISKTQH
jgi:hypothetical protein